MKRGGSTISSSFCGQISGPLKIAILLFQFCEHDAPSFWYKQAASRYKGFKRCNSTASSSYQVVQGTLIAQDREFFLFLFFFAVQKTLDKPHFHY